MYTMDDTLYIAVSCTTVSMYCTRYCSAAIDKRVRGSSLYHCRQCSIVLKPRSDRIDYTVVCFMTHDCSPKLWKDSSSVSWVWFKCIRCISLPPCVLHHFVWLFALWNGRQSTTWSLESRRLMFIVWSFSVCWGVLTSGGCRIFE